MANPELYDSKGKFNLLRYDAIFQEFYAYEFPPLKSFRTYSKYIDDILVYIEDIKRAILYNLRPEEFETFRDDVLGSVYYLNRELWLYGYPKLLSDEDRVQAFRRLLKVVPNYDLDGDFDVIVRDNLSSNFDFVVADLFVSFHTFIEFMDPEVKQSLPDLEKITSLLKDIYGIIKNPIPYKDVEKARKILWIEIFLLRFIVRENPADYEYLHDHYWDNFNLVGNMLSSLKEDEASFSATYGHLQTTSGILYHALDIGDLPKVISSKDLDQTTFWQNLTLNERTCLEEFYLNGARVGYDNFIKRLSAYNSQDRADILDCILNIFKVLATASKKEVTV